MHALCSLGPFSHLSLLQRTFVNVEIWNQYKRKYVCMEQCDEIKWKLPFVPVKRNDSIFVSTTAEQAINLPLWLFSFVISKEPIYELKNKIVFGYPKL